MVSKHVSEGDQCFMCGEDNPHVLVSHHIVPSAYGGTDEKFNRVVLCANHHQAIHGIYSDEVFTRLGVPKENGDTSDSDVDDLSDFEDLTATEQFEFLKRQMSEKELSDALAGIFVGGTFPQIGESKDAESIDKMVEEDPAEFDFLDLEEQFKYLVRNHKDIVYPREDRWANPSVIDAAIEHAWDIIRNVEGIGDDDADLETGRDSSTEDESEESIQEMKWNLVEKHVLELAEEYDDSPGVPEQKLITAVSNDTLPNGVEMSEEEVSYTIQQLRDKGRVYSPTQEHILHV